MKQRSLLIFEQTIKSRYTRRNYLDHLDRFLKFTNLKDYDSILKVDPAQLQTILEDYVIHLKNTVNPNSVAVYMTGVKHFCIMNRIKVFWEIIQKMYPQRVKQSGQKAWSTEHIQTMLKFTASKRNKAIIHFLASTGARIGAFNYPLQMQHLREMDGGCMSVLIYAGEPEEYWAFLTPEASSVLREYHEQRADDNERFYPDTPIIRTTYRLGMEKPRPLSSKGVMNIIDRIVNRSRIRRTRVHKNYDIHLDHGFRKRFNIILKLEDTVNSNIAEKIMGHSVTIPLDGTYLPSTDPRVMKKCFEEFQKAIPELTVDGTTRKQLLLEQQEKKTCELENKINEIKEVSARQTFLEQILGLSGNGYCSQEDIKKFLDWKKENSHS